MLNKLKLWFDPRVPLPRVGFVIAQVVGYVLEGVLRHKLDPTEIDSKGVYVACALALFTQLAIVTAKRLLDVNWSRRWVLVILGPSLFDILFGVGNANSAVLKVAFYPLFVSYVGYMILVVVLAFVPGKGEFPMSEKSKGTA